MLNKILSISAIIIALSIMYYLVIRPIHKDNELGNCLLDAHNMNGSNTRRQQAKENCYKQY